MKFKLIKKLGILEEKNLIKFFLKSKPFSFCEMPSMSLCLSQIKKYIDFLFENCEVYTSEDFFIAIFYQDKIANIEFIFGKPFKISSDFKDFRGFLKETRGVEEFRSMVQRHHKKQKYLNFIKRRDKDVKISVDNGKIYVLWNT